MYLSIYRLNVSKPSNFSLVCVRQVSQINMSAHITHEKRVYSPTVGSIILYSADKINSISVKIC